MNKINELKQSKADFAAQAVALIAEAGDDDFSKEQQEKYTKLKAEIEKTQHRLDRAIDQAELERTAATKVVEDTRSIEVRAGFEDDPKHGFKTSRDFLMAVMHSEVTHRVDDRLVKFKAPAAGFQAAVGSDEQGVYSPTYGGFLVPTTLAPGIMSTDPEVDFLAGRITEIPMTTTKVNINARVDKNHSSSVSGGLTVSRKDETSAATSSRMSFEQIEMNAHALFGLAYASELILQDSPTSFVALLNAGFRDEMASNAMDERLNGSGVGEYLGVLSSNNSAKISQAKEGSQTATTIVKANIDKMRSRCWGYGSAVWIANNDTFPQLASLSQEVGSSGGAPVDYFKFDPSGPTSLLGRPIFFTEHCATLGTVNDIVLGNWTQYLHGTYQGVQSAESIHVRFTEHERAFKFWLRDDAQPWWSSVLTPKNGSTLAPFITLATRA